jgi:hypothetical protein
VANEDKEEQSDLMKTRIKETGEERQETRETEREGEMQEEAALVVIISNRKGRASHRHSGKFTPAASQSAARTVYYIHFYYSRPMRCIFSFRVSPVRVGFASPASRREPAPFAFSLLLVDARHLLVWL